MGKKLAIQGHTTRGNEVIALLEKLGGHADDLLDNGIDEKYAYFIVKDENNVIDAFPIDKKDEFDFAAQIFTLEEFLEKYPYKVGYKVLGCYGNTLTIKSMKWSEDFETMVYDFEETEDVLCAEDLEAVNDMGLKIEKNTNKNIEFDLTKYSYEIKDGKLVISEKKPKYPDNYDECVRIAKNIHGYDIHIDVPAYGELMESFVKLLICRDAYWKIAGEQMGLDKSWEPNWENGRNKCCIINCENRIIRGVYAFANAILAFPTEEMRDVFHENFKDLIEQCKELL